MNFKLNLVTITTATLLVLGAIFIMHGVPATAAGRSRITGQINDHSLVTLTGNTRPAANLTNDRGAVADDLPMEHITLLLRRSIAREQALKTYLASLSDQKSPDYHKWLTAAEFGDRFGADDQDIHKITAWMTARGLTVNRVYANRIAIDFSGRAEAVETAFHTPIHELQVRGKRHIANMRDPQIPAALASVIRGIVSLNDFKPRALNHPRAAYTYACTGGNCYAVVPADLATIYNLNPLFASGYSGQGQTIVVVEDSDVYKTEDFSTFRNTFGLTNAYPQGALIQTHPGCSDPGVNGDDSEAEIDAEWASATAPSATIELASCPSTTNFGGFIALANLLNGSNPGIVSISYGESEPELGSAENAYINSLYQQAAAQGVSVFVSSGDEGAASTDANGGDAATHGISVSGLTSTPYNVSVGGTDFGDTYAGTDSAYWNQNNGPTYGSALSYIPEIPWNDSCASRLTSTFFGYTNPYGSAGFCNSSEAQAGQYLNNVAGSGGPSGCASGTPSVGGVVSGSCRGYAKPGWQSIVGNPHDGVRDIPDLSLFASNGIWSHYYVVCYSDPNGGGYSCAGAPSTWAGFGGTSFASPIMAAIQAIANQRAGSNQGNPNPLYYSLANTEYGGSGDASCNSTLGSAAAASCIFYDVTLGDMDVDCTGTHNCFTPSGTYGALSSSNASYAPAFGTNIGWDFATGIGSVNAYNFVMAFPAGASPSPTPTATPTSTPSGGSPTPTPSPVPTPTPVAEKLKVSSRAIHFGRVKLGRTSALRTISIKNPAHRNAVPVIVQGEQVNGNSAFTLINECAETLAPGAKCVLTVSFSPVVSGRQSAILTITGNSIIAPPIVTLVGNGISAP